MRVLAQVYSGLGLRSAGCCVHKQSPLVNHCPPSGTLTLLPAHLHNTPANNVKRKSTPTKKIWIKKEKAHKERIKTTPPDQ